VVAFVAPLPYDRSDVSDVIIAAEQLHKTFQLGLFRKHVTVVRDVTFEVKRGEVFGLLGPNGAGKTTILKLLLGLIFPTSGRATLFGRPVTDVEAKRRLGFLPESPYFYDYLSGEELLDLMGRLFGLGRAERRRRTAQLLERVGLGRAGDRPLRKYSRGMLQRLGIAQALINDPELVVLDEPMTGLDPLGRKEIRDLILELRQEGKTILFSTHILPDVELVCSRAAIVVGGRLRASGPLGSLLSPRLLHTEVIFERAGQIETQRLAPAVDVAATLKEALASGAYIVSVTPRRESLEDLFVREVQESDLGAGAEHRRQDTPDARDRA
jgi:ABC-2 type transport system ATP-binding protein